MVTKNAICIEQILSKTLQNGHRLKYEVLKRFLMLDKKAQYLFLLKQSFLSCFWSISLLFTCDDCIFASLLMITRAFLNRTFQYNKTIERPLWPGGRKGGCIYRLPKQLNSLFSPDVIQILKSKQLFYTALLLTGSSYQ